MSYSCRKGTGALTEIPALLYFGFSSCRLELNSTPFVRQYRILLTNGVQFIGVLRFHQRRDMGIHLQGKDCRKFIISLLRFKVREFSSAYVLFSGGRVCFVRGVMTL